MAKPSRKPVAKTMSKSINTTAAKENSIEEIVYIQFQNKEISHKTALNLIKNAWKADGNDEKSIKSIDAYVKPEEGQIYYVINGSINGSIGF